MSTARLPARITKKGQVTVPSKLRKKFRLEGGKSNQFEESDRGILMRPVPDIIDSAGALSKSATAAEMIHELLESRGKSFR